MADVDAWNLNKARAVMKARLLKEIKTKIVDPIIDQRRNDGDCVKIFYEGTVKPIKKGSDVEFGIEGQKFTDFHGNDLETDQLFDGWAEIILGETIIYNSSNESCDSPSQQPSSTTMEIPLKYAKGDVLFSDNPHPTDSSLKDRAVAKQDCVVNFEASVIVTVRTTKCFTAVRIDDSGLSEETIATSLTSFTREILPPIIASVIRNRPVVAAIAAEVSTATRETGAEGGTQLAEGVAAALKPKLKALFEDSSFQLFPPSVSFGQGEHEITISPTVGGSDSPGAQASIGVQVDINPSGEGRTFIGRFTAGVDVDASGKPVGGFFGWKCRF